MGWGPRSCVASTALARPTTPLPSLLPTLLLQVVGLTERRVESAEEMLRLVKEAEEARATGATSANETSSRSHAILRVQLRDASGKIIGKLSMVDLAVRYRAGAAQPTPRPPSHPFHGQVRTPSASQQTHRICAASEIATTPSRAGPHICRLQLDARRFLLDPRAHPV